MVEAARAWPANVWSRGIILGGVPIECRRVPVEVSTGDGSSSWSSTPACREISGSAEVQVTGGEKKVILSPAKDRACAKWTGSACEVEGPRLLEDRLQGYRLLRRLRTWEDDSQSG
jgi:hypothetical protein